MRHLGPIAGIAAYGKWVATAGYDNRLILWDAKTRQAIALANHDHLVNACAFSPDGRWLVSSSSDYSARIWSVPDLRLQAVLAEHGDDVDMAMFSSDGQKIATCALDRIVRIYTCNGQLRHSMSGHTGNVISVSWLPDSRFLVSSSVDGTIRLWDSDSGLEVQKTDLSIRADSVEVDANGRIYAGDDFGRIALIENGVPRFFPAHQSGIKKISLSRCQKKLVALSYDRSLSVWKILDNGLLTEAGRISLPPDVWARAGVFLDDQSGTLIATGTFGGTYALFDLETGQCDLTGVAPGAAINSVQMDQGKIISVGDSGQVKSDGQVVAEMGSLCNFLITAQDRWFAGGQLGQLFDGRTGAVLYQHHSPLNCAVTFVVGSIHFLAVGTYTGEIILFRVGESGGISFHRSLPVYENAVKGLAFDGGVLFSVCASTDIAWHDAVEDFVLTRRISKAHERIVNACCAIGDQEFVSVGRDKVLRIWGSKDMEHHVSRHPNSIKCVAVNERKDRILTGSYGGTLIGFDLMTRSWGRLIKPSIAGISSITWNEADGCFVAAAYDGSIYKVTEHEAFASMA